MTDTDLAKDLSVMDREPEGDRPQMSEAGTIVGVFFEPGRTFEDLRRKPRFILAAILIALFISAYGFALNYKVGSEGMRRFMVEQIEKNPQAAGMPTEDKNKMIDLQLTIQSYVRYALPIIIFIFLLLGGLIYFLGGKAFGGSGGFMHALSVWVYSSLPPTVIGMIGSLIVMAFKPVEQIDIATSQRGLLQANPSIFIDGKANPILATLIGTIDLFMIWGWVLAAIGLRVTNKISSGSAWAIVIIVAIIGVLFRIISAIFSGNPS